MNYCERWKCWQYILPKCWYLPANPHGVTIQINIASARRWEPQLSRHWTYCLCCCWRGFMQEPLAQSWLSGLPSTVDASLCHWAAKGVFASELHMFQRISRARNLIIWNTNRHMRNKHVPTYKYISFHEMSVLTKYNETISSANFTYLGSNRWWCR
jgi:hypothetical protein